MILCTTRSVHDHLLFSSRSPCLSLRLILTLNKREVDINISTNNFPQSLWNLVFQHPCKLIIAISDVTVINFVQKNFSLIFAVINLIVLKLRFIKKNIS